MKIPVAKPFLTENEAQAAYDTILSGWVTQGPRVQEFEEKFARYVGAKYAVAVSSCTTALHLALIVSGIQPGDEVICPSMSYIATANSIKHAGAKPVFAEVTIEDYNMDPTYAESLINECTKAIMIVHQMGAPADIDAFKRICDKYNLKLIEDAACAIGSEYKGKKIGIHSNLVCFSFHPRKLITTGDGGMITTANEDYCRRLRHLRQHGMSINDRMRHEAKTIVMEEYLETGYNYRMTDIQAAVGIKQLEKIDWIVQERRRIAFQYIELLKDIDCIVLPVEKSYCQNNYQSFSIYLKKKCPIKRNDLMAKLLATGISTRRGVMTSHREPAYKKESVDVKLPVSEDASDNSIILPLFVPMKDEEIIYVCNNFKNIMMESKC
jgi:dTDP-4-amino-4,6-dideoxygalactose transaminase